MHLHVCTVIKVHMAGWLAHIHETVSLLLADKVERAAVQATLSQYRIASIPCMVLHVVGWSGFALQLCVEFC